MGEGVPAIFTGLSMRHAAAAFDGSGDPPQAGAGTYRGRQTTIRQTTREQDNEPRLSFQRTVLSDRVTVPEPGDDLRTWKRMNGNIALGFETMEVVHLAERDRSATKRS